MKKILLILAVLLSVSAIGQKKYYVAPGGSDNNPGTITQPFGSWQKLTLLKGGDTAFIRGGQYRSLKAKRVGNYPVDFRNISGTAAAPIIIMAYPGEFPVLNLDDIQEKNFMIGFYILSCNYIKIKGLRITGFKQPTAGALEVFRLENSVGITLEQCEADHNGGTGFRIKNPATSVTNIVNCDADNNADPLNTGGNPYGNADGFDLTGGIINVTGCRAWWNSDDGFDCYYNDSHVTFKNCWSFRNGYIPGTFNPAGNGNGYKWGIATTPQPSTILRTYINTISFDNKTYGYDQNTAKCIAEFYNCVSYRHKQGWAMNYSISPAEPNILRNCISFQDGTPIANGGFALSTLKEDHNTWDGIPASASSFASLDTSGVGGKRKPDGSLPDVQFLHLSATSNLIDKGVDVGYGNDLGAFQYGGITPPPIFTNGIQSKAFVRNNCTSGTGSVVTYTVPEGKYSASTQAGADQLAISDINANGQAYANTNGTCSVTPPPTYFNASTAKSFTKNNCTAGTGTSVIYTVPTAKYSSLISQADADLKAVQDINTNGQTYANVNGFCVPPPVNCSWWDKLFKRHGCHF